MSRTLCSPHGFSGQPGLRQLEHCAGGEVTFRAFCEGHAGARRIGLGECTGTVQAAVESAHWAAR